MGLVSFSDLKIKLMGAIVAISGIELLKTFANTKAHEQSEICLRIGTFVIFLFAVMDRISSGHEPVPGDFSPSHVRSSPETGAEHEGKGQNEPANPNLVRAPKL